MSRGTTRNLAITKISLIKHPSHLIDIELHHCACEPGLPPQFASQVAARNVPSISRYLSSLFQMQVTGFGSGKGSLRWERVGNHYPKCVVFTKTSFGVCFAEVR